MQSPVKRYFNSAAVLAASIGVIVLFSACTAGYNYVTASREKASTPAWTGTQMAIEIVAILQELNRVLGVTILPVAHEPDIATDTPRILHIRDDLLDADDAITFDARLNADNEAGKRIETDMVNFVTFAAILAGDPSLLSAACVGCFAHAVGENGEGKP